MKLINIFKIRKNLIGFLCFLFLFFVSSLPANKADAALGIVGSYTHPNMQGAWNSTISGNYAYVTAPEVDCLTILDITTVTAPAYVGSVCDGIRLDYAYGVFVYGNYAYVVSRVADSLSVIDISNPAAPFIAGYISDSVNLDTPVNVFVSDNYAFVTGRDLNRLTAVNISNPASPVVASSIQRNTELCGAWDVKIVGSLAYVTARGFGSGCPVGEGNRLTIINVSNPLAMSYVGSVRDNEQLNVAYSVDVVGNYAYVTSRGNAVTPEGDRLTVVNISSPASPAIVGSIKDNNLLNGAKGVKVFGFMAYVSGYDADSLVLINILDPANPFIADSFQNVAINQAYGLSFRSGYSYISSEELGTGKFTIISGIPDTINPTLTTEAWRPDSVGVQVANGGTINYADIDQAGEKVTIYSTASDDSGIVVDHKIRYWKNGILQPVSSWATGGLHSVAINGPLAPGDVIEYQSEATDESGNISVSPSSGRYVFRVSQNDMNLGSDAANGPGTMLAPGVMSGTGSINDIDEMDCYKIPLVTGQSTTATLTYISGDPNDIWIMDYMLPYVGGPYDGSHSSFGWNGPIALSPPFLSTPQTLTYTTTSNGDYGWCVGRGFIPPHVATPLLFGNSLFRKYQLDITTSPVPPQCCPALGACTITVSPCILNGNYIGGGNLEVNVNTASPVRIILTGNVNMSMYSNVLLNNQFAGANKQLVITGAAPAGVARNGYSFFLSNNGDVDFASGGTTIDLSVPRTSTGNGGALTITSNGTATIQSSADLKIYTYAGNADNLSGAGKPIGGSVNLTLNGDLNFSANSVMQTGTMIGNNTKGGNITVLNNGGITKGPINLFSTSSSDVAGNINVTSNGDMSIGAHANGGIQGGTIDFAGNGSFYAPSCNNSAVEATNNGLIRFNAFNGIVDLPPDTRTVAGTLSVGAMNELSNCSCLSGGGSCYTQLLGNNANVQMNALLCDETDPLAVCSGTPLPTIQFSLASSNDTENTTPANLQVSLSNSSTSDVAVNYAVTGGTATGGGVDYMLASGTATIMVGFVSTNILITVVDDALGEPDETIIVTLSAPSNATLGANIIHTYTISANDTPTVQFTESSSSGAENVTPANLEVSLSNTSTSSVTVNYAVTGGTATGGDVDYMLASGTATIMAGFLNINIPISIVNDVGAEPDETIIVTLSNPTNAGLGSNTVHTYAINDDDSINVLSVLDIISPNGDSIIQGDIFGINYSLSDPDDVTTAALYYDNDTGNANGYVGAIAGCGAIPESAGAVCNWDTTGATPGVYYVYGETSDGVNDYSPGTITIVGAGQSGNLEGFAWSDTVGWISFSSKDCDLDGNGQFDDAGAPLGCPMAGTAFSYGVQMDLDTDILSGYAWSDNIGWISFNWPEIEDAGNACPSGSGVSCQSRLDTGLNQMKGWARACSVFSSGCSGALKPSTETGGWDGWISLNEGDCDVQGGGPNGFLDVACGGDNTTRTLNDCDVNDNGWLDGACGGDDSSDIANSCDSDNNDWLDVACGGVDNNSIPINVGYRVSFADPNLSGWAWGGDVVGWISFDGVSVRTGDNKPILTLFGQTPIDYCIKDLAGAVSLKWDFNDFENGYGMQTAYEIEIDRSDGQLCRPGKQGDSITPNRDMTLLGTEINALCPIAVGEFIEYGGHIYTWKLRVFDSDNNFNSGSADGFLAGDAFPFDRDGDAFDGDGNDPEPTPTHRYPIANFTVDPPGNWIAMMPIDLDPFHNSLGSEKTQSFTASGEINSLVWVYDGSEELPPIDPGLPPYAEGAHVTTKSNFGEGPHNIDLEVTDSDGITCKASQRGHAKNIDVLTNKPKWNEAAP